VAVSLAAGAASLASAFPPLRHHLLAMCLAGLIVITAVNLWGIAESARVLMLPMVVFLAAIFGVIVIGLVRSHPAAIVGTTQPVRVNEAVGVILILKAFAAGCSALTGIEAIANGVPVFREPRARRAPAHRADARRAARRDADRAGGADPPRACGTARRRHPGPGAGRQHQLRRPAGADEPAVRRRPAAPPPRPAGRTAGAPLRRGLASRARGRPADRGQRRHRPAHPAVRDRGVHRLHH